VREHPDTVRASQRARGADESLVDDLLAADAARREAVGRADHLRAEQKTASAEVKEAEEAQRAADAALRTAHLKIPNVIAAEVPPGGEDDAVTLRTVGEVPTYDFPVRDHIEIGEALGAIDMERGAKVSGARFYFLTGPGALLEFALAQLAISRAVAAGFIPVIAPALVKPEAMEGTGFLGEHDEEVYRIERDDLYLVGTSEVALAGMHAKEVLDLSAGPRRYAGWSSCFRREAGSYGKDTRGIIRVHWFDKVEMFSFCRPEETRAEHLRLLGWEEEFLQALELPYRVVDIAAGDLGTSATRKYDIEAWFPTQGTYRELTSTSDCTTFQARRLNIRYRDEDGKPQPAATLNGTLCAIARTIACLLEVHQRAEGSVYVPQALRPWLGGVEELTPGMKLAAAVPPA